MDITRRIVQDQCTQPVLLSCVTVISHQVDNAHAHLLLSDDCGGVSEKVRMYGETGKASLFLIRHVFLIVDVIIDNVYSIKKKKKLIYEQDIRMATEMDSFAEVLLPKRH